MKKLFSNQQEKQYKIERYTSDLSAIRSMLILCVFFYAVFGVLDYYIGVMYISLFLFIRFVIVIPIFIIGIGVSYTKNFYRVHQYILVALYIIAGIGIAVMLIMVPDNFSYYGGLFLIFAVGHLLTRMYWQYVTFGSAVIIVTYTIASIVARHLSIENTAIYISFYIGFVIISSYGSYNYDYYKLEKFKQTYGLRGDKVVLQKQIYDNMLDLDNANKITIYSMAKLADSRDHFTGGHIDRVGKKCQELAESLNESIYVKNGEEKLQFVKYIALASTLHDIGKVAIPESILLKPDKLTAQEMEIMKTHPIIGYDTLYRIKEVYQKNNFINMGLDICRYHHERWDGGGYPDGLKGEEIPLSARIVSIIDVFDALINNRPYKQAFAIEDALELIKAERGKMFDPDVTDAFLNLFIMDVGN